MLYRVIILTTAVIIVIAQKTRTNNKFDNFPISMK